MQQTRLFLLVLAFQLFLLLLVSLPAWRASGSAKLSTRAGWGVVTLLTAVALLAGQGVLPNFVAHAVAPCLLLSGLRLTYAAAYDLCDVPPPPRWERWLAAIGCSAVLILWLADRSPGQLALARVRFMTIAIPVAATTGCWLLQLRHRVRSSWSLGTRYLFWAAGIALLMDLFRIVGVLLLHGNQDPLQNSLAPIAVLATLPTSLLVAVGLILQIEARIKDRLLVANVQLTHDAETDLLTGLGNRRRLETAGVSELARARRYGWPITVMVLDLDHFKAINDRWGHHAGDAVLREIANRCLRVLRSHEVLVRWGGEEFALLLPQCDLATSENVAQRLLESVRDISMEAIGCEHFTASIGLAAVEPGEPTIDTALQRADAALYAAKRAGRNQYAIAGAPTPEEMTVAEPVSAESFG